MTDSTMPYDPYRNLARQAQQGNKEALVQLVKDFLPMLFRFHYRLGMSADEAERYSYYTIRNIAPAFVQYDAKNETFRSFIIRLTIFCRNHETRLTKLENDPYVPNMLHRERNSTFYEQKQGSLLLRFLSKLDLVGRTLFCLIRLEKVPIFEVEKALNLDHDFIIDKLVDISDSMVASDEFKAGAF